MEAVWKSRSNGFDPAFRDTSPLPLVVKKILAARGLASLPQVQDFLFPKLQGLKDPLSIMNMDRAVLRLVQAFKKNEAVAIYADFDLDGTSGLAMMMTGLKQLGFENVLPYQPARLSEGYGFHPEAVESLHRENVKLIMTVDVGITAVDAAQKAKELDMDVIITDHHLTGPTLPECLAIVNPNQPGDNSGLGYLSGAGVAFYLLRALKRELLNVPGAKAGDFDLKDVLEYFTIATLTDMVPLVEDNRVLVKHGLLKFSQTEKPGLRALKVAVGIEGRSLTSQDVAIRLAPKLNALSRMGSEILPVDILLCEDEKTAQGLIHRVLENNQNRVHLQAEAEIELQNYLAGKPEEDFLFLVSPRFHRGLVGLLATKLSQEGQRPAFIGSLDEATGNVVGSARRPPGFDGCLVEILSSAKDELTRFGGHSQAAGFEFEFHKFDEVKQSFRKMFEKRKFRNEGGEVFFDSELEFSEISPQLMKWLEHLGPFGAQFECPVFLFKNLKLRGVKELRGGHLRLTCLNREGQGVQEGLLFSPSAKQREILAEGSMNYDLLGELQWNYYNGRQTVQLLIRDIRVAQWH